MGQENKSWKRTAGKKDEHVDSRLSGDRDSKGEGHVPGTLEDIVEGDRKEDKEMVQQTIEKNLRDQKRVGAPNQDATGLVEKRLNEAKQTLYPHRNDEAWARTGEKRPINALPEEMGKSSDDKKRERWNTANKSGAKRALDKDVGKQLDLPKTTIQDKAAFNLRSTKVAALKPYEGYLAYRSSTAGGWSDKFASVREIDAKVQEILSKNASLSKPQQDEIDALKSKKASILGISTASEPPKDYAKYTRALQRMPDVQLQAIARDALEAAEANPENPKAQWYRTESELASAELRRRGKA